MVFRFAHGLQGLGKRHWVGCKKRTFASSTSTRIPCAAFALPCRRSQPSQRTRLRHSSQGSWASTGVSREISPRTWVKDVVVGARHGDVLVHGARARPKRCVLSQRLDRRCVGHAHVSGKKCFGHRERLIRGAFERQDGAVVQYLPRGFFRICPTR